MQGVLPDYETLFFVWCAPFVPLRRCYTVFHPGTLWDTLYGFWIMQPLYCHTSCPARRCSGIRAPRRTRSLRSTWSAQLCRFAITQPTDEQTPRRKIAHRWACIIAAFNLEKEAILISNGKRLNIMVFNISSEKSREKTSINVKLQHNIAVWLPAWRHGPPHSIASRSLDSHINSFDYGDFFWTCVGLQKNFLKPF